MKTLNDDFKTFCEPNISKIISEDNYIFRIKSFFKYPQKAREFFLSLPKWDCDDLDKNTKPGMETFLPTWANDYLTEKTLFYNKIYPIYKDNVIVNMHYFKMPKKMNSWRSSNGTFDLPHHDHKKGNNIPDMYVLLVNLNDVPIETNFWEFNGNQVIKDDDYNDYVTKFQEKNLNEDLNKLKIPKEIKLHRRIKYDFNESIIYNAARLHNANVTDNFTKENPRITLRYMFYVNESKNLLGYSRKNIDYF